MTRRLLLSLFAINAALIVAGAVFVPAPPPAVGAKVHIGMVFDIGGKNDKSFNEGAFRGLARARAELGVQIQLIEPSEGADRESALRRLAAGGNDLVIGVGFIFGPALERIAGQFPNVKFAGVDYTPTEGVKIPPNLVGLRFREHEGSFVVGAIAAMVSRSHVVGFVGGMEIPLIKKFEAGYKAGVRYVCPTCVVKAAYAGTTPRAFTDPSKGQELAAAQYDSGADIIFHASGKTGDGVFTAARQRRKRVIGVDSDQHDAAACCVVTSMLKRVDVAVVDIVKTVIAGQFKGGAMIELGIAEHGIDFVANEQNRNLLPLDVVAKARKLADEIVAGTIVVPSQ